MVIKHGDKAARPSWEYPDDLDGFLTVIGASLSDLKEAALRVDIFMHGHDAYLMPNELRQTLIRCGLLNPRIRYG